MSQSLPGTIGGRYRVTRQLGQGGMGAVYEAVDAHGRRVAVKVITSELAANATLVGRFELEAKTASAIDTPHIAKTLDFGTDAETGLPFLVMELLDGEDVDQILKRLGALPSDLALRIAAQACLALQKAHDARVLHRDIKPANLFMAKQDGGRMIKLLDFGVAKVKPEVSRTTAETRGLTRTGSMLGSPLYMSPEQARGYKTIDFRSDLWSLGIVLYKMLSGRTPHDETDELGELIVLICTEPPAPIQDVAPWVPPPIAALVHRALRFNPAERYASAGEMLAALQTMLPNGHAIAEGMIRPISDAEKVAAAPRLMLDLTDAPAPRKPGQTTGAGGVSAGLMSTGPVSAGPVSAGPVFAQTPAHGAGATSHASAPYAPNAGPAGGSTMAPLGSFPGQTFPGQTLSGAAPRRSALPWVIMAAIGVVAGVGVGVFRFAYDSAPPAGGSPGSSASAAADGKPRSALVVILPANASVEVDGAAVTLSEGVLELSGAIGSVHKVRVAAGGVEKEVRVVIAESGAIPPKIEIQGAATEPAASGAATAAPATATAKPRPKSSSAASDDLRNKR